MTTVKPKKKILVITDNIILLTRFKKLVKNTNIKNALFYYRYSFNNGDFSNRFKKNKTFLPINTKNDYRYIIANYDLVISLHCKQIFPKELIEKIPCINVHPGFNPYNRGWYPQVFSIINKLPIGATIHVIDERIDHGQIIAQALVDVRSSDTSLDVYERIVDKEFELLKKNLVSIVNSTYQTIKPTVEGNLNTKKDFELLREIDLAQTGTFGELIDRLRALTHGDFQNAYFADTISGKKIFVSIKLTETETTHE